MLLFTRNYRGGNDAGHGPWTSGLMSREKSVGRGLFRAPRNTVDLNRSRRGGRRGEEEKEEDSVESRVVGRAILISGLEICLEGG